MVEPIRRSSDASAMMRRSMEDAEALGGMTVLVAGDDLGAVQAVRDRLAALGADATALAGDTEAIARAAAADPPAAVLAVGAAEAALRSRLDPFGLEAGPPVISLAAVADAEDGVGPLAARRLRALAERAALRARQSELEGVLAAQAVTRRREVEAARVDTLDRLITAAGYRDDNTYEHTQRVGHLAARLARGLGMGDREIWRIRRTAPLHDIGKIAIPDSILLKPGKLTDEEFEVVKTHAVLGARVLAKGGSDLLETAEAIARHHHERWDGGGYPEGLAGEAIPIAARLVHVADVFDILVHERPYKESWTVEAAAREIAGGAGTQFDPEAVGAFTALGPAGWGEAAGGALRGTPQAPASAADDPGVHPRYRTPWLLPCLLALLFLVLPARASADFSMFSVPSGCPGVPAGDLGITATDSTAPPSGWQSSDVVASLAGTNVAGWEWMVDCGPVQSGGPGQTVTFNVSGSYRLSHRAQDGNGLWTDWSDDFIQLDKIAPNNTSTSQPGWSNVPVDITVKGGDSTSAIDHVEYNLDSAGVQSGPSGTSLHIPSDGTHTLDTQVFDLA